ncbi:hypothetical protein ACFX13_002028 [Malus domestica]
MMPFGAGRRICPASGLAVLHLEYFVANLVWKFQWRAVEGDDVDLSEKTEFTVVMKNPLQAHGGGSGTQQIVIASPYVRIITRFRNILSESDNMCS